MSDYSKFSLDRLKGTIDINTNKLLEMKLNESPNQATIQVFHY